MILVLWIGVVPKIRLNRAEDLLCDLAVIIKVYREILLNG